MQYRNKYTHQTTCMHRLQTETLTHTHSPQCIWVCWFGVSDRVRGISLITWDEEVERYGQHVKDGPTLSWSSPSRPILLFPKFLQLGSADVGSVHRSPTVIAFITERKGRTRKNQGTGSAEFLKNPSQMKLSQSSGGRFNSPSPRFSLSCAVWTFVVCYCCFYGKSQWLSCSATLQPACAY